MKRVRRKQRNRVLALVLSVAVVMSPMTLPGQTVYAADGKIDLSAYIEKKNRSYKSINYNELLQRYAY